MEQGPHQSTLNIQLAHAVESFQVVKVEEFLKKGADPNFNWIIENAEVGTDQPDTPLKLVVFRISDAMLSTDDLLKYTEITRILLEYGADPVPALKLAEARYGKYDPGRPSDPFADILHILAGNK